MANIADNLKRLLGTTGHNIQEILENADSLGGSGVSIPSIEFETEDDENWSISECKGIPVPSEYSGACIVKIKYAGENTVGTWFANAVLNDTDSAIYYHELVPSGYSDQWFRVKTDGTVAKGETSSMDF